MRRNFGRSVGLGAMTVMAAGAAYANDPCDNAIAVTPGTYFGSTIGATNDGSATCGLSELSPDVWYEFTAPAEGRLTVSACGFGTDYDTVISIHSGCPGTDLNELDCNDDSCGLASSASAVLVAGQTVKIRIAGFDGESGNFEILVSFGPGGPPPNDTCATAIPLENGSTVFDNTEAFSDGPFGSLCTDAYRDLWYTYRATCTGTATFSLCNSSFDTVVTLFDACDGTELACNDDSDLCGLQSILTADVTAGRTYYFRIGGYDEEFSYGVGQIDVTCEGTGGCEADFNGDQQVDFFDYLDFASAFDAEDISADFNGDNQIDFFDYLDFVAAFDNCQ